jgi:DNA-binding CsgD family transcriptional regulator
MSGTTSRVAPVGKDNARLLDDIYSAALDSGHWPHVLACLAGKFDGSVVYLAQDNFAMTEGRYLSFGTDPNYARLYAEHYVTCNVVGQRVLRRSLGEAVTSRMLIANDEFRRSEFYNDFLVPQDSEEILACVALKQADRADTVVLGRPERFGVWQSEHMEAIAALTPHLRRALQVNHGVGELRITRDLASEALHRLEHAVILVGAQARVLFANRGADAILADGKGLSIRKGRLAAGRPSDDAALLRLIDDVAQNRTGGSLAIAREGRPSLLIIVMPPSAEARWMFHDPPSAILFVKDMERPATLSLTAFAHHFELSPAETAMVRELARGDGATAAATRLGISWTTARTHLSHVFQKTGMHRQAELIRLMGEWNVSFLAEEVGDNPSPARR